VATVELGFSALPAHVRTARLVAATVARRSGVDEALVDEVKLAVGEACSRAVGLHARSAPDKLIQLLLSDEDNRFTVCVHDVGPAGEEMPDVEGERLTAPELVEAAGAGTGGVPLDADTALPAGVGLAVIAGLVDDVEIISGDDGVGTAVRMSWPIRPPSVPASRSALA
jgi:serine/threonine-protein kinase RsbW